MVRGKLTQLKLRKRALIRSRLLLADPTRKKFWRFLKGHIQGAGNITAVSDSTDPTGKLLFEQKEIEEVVLNHFSNIFYAKRVPVETNNEEVNEVDLVIAEIDQMLENRASASPNQYEKQMTAPYTYSELDELLSNLPNNKASGYDGIANEFLKNAGPGFKQYLLVFLNKILEEGAVPVGMNNGKCMLIHKVKI